MCQWTVTTALAAQCMSIRPGCPSRHPLAAAPSAIATGVPACQHFHQLTYQQSSLLTGRGGSSSSSSSSTQVACRAGEASRLHALTVPVLDEDVTDLHNFSVSDSYDAQDAHSLALDPASQPSRQEQVRVNTDFMHAGARAM